jgi:hypothetical protein
MGTKADGQQYTASRRAALGRLPLRPSRRFLPRMLIDLGYAFGAIHADENGRFIAHLYIDKSKCG